MSVRHFLTLNDLTQAELVHIINRAIELKALQHQKQLYQPFAGYVMGMIFEKSSTRTRVSFEAAMTQFGGSAIFLSPRDTQLGRGEPIEDTARVLSRMVDIVMIRTFGHDQIEKFAAHSQVPVINGLTDTHHPCQLLADIQTFVELRGPMTGKTVAWIGDGNNMCHSYMQAATMLDFKLKIATPTGYEPLASWYDDCADHVTLVHDAATAAQDSDLIVTDVWTSMGDEQEQQQRLQAFAQYQVTEQLMALAKPDCLFMHCLPAHRGEEISATLLDQPYAVVWQEAENRLHAQKALIEFLLHSSE